MSKVFIENYRGFDIEFDTDYAKFQCVLTEDNSKESPSFPSIKKFIDDYKKDNQDFKPFWIEPNVSEMAFKSKRLKVVGLRKDGRFVAEDENGNKEQISDFDLKYYMVVKEENKPILAELNQLKELEERQRNENKSTLKSIISRLDIETLEDFKKKLLS